MFYDDFMRRFALGRHCDNVGNGGYLVRGIWIMYAYVVIEYIFFSRMLHID